MLIKDTIVIAVTILALTATTTFAADGMKYENNDLYRSGEVSLDVFGSAAVGKYTIDHLSGNRLRHNSRLGAGLGITYFLNRNIGIGADAYSENTSGSLVDSTSLNLVARFPLGQSGFAPYVFGGGGYQFDGAETAFAQAGAGIEYRFSPHVGLFLDARGVLPDKTKYYGVGRLGMRFAF